MIGAISVVSTLPWCIFFTQKYQITAAEQIVCTIRIIAVPISASMP